MRVAIVTTSFPSAEDDPAGHFVRAEARELTRSGHDVTVIAAPAGGAFGWPGVAARVREQPLRAFGAARWVVQARARVRRLDVDRIVSHWAVPCGWPIASAAPSAELEIVSHGGDVRLLLRAPRLLRDAVTVAVASRACAWRFVSAALRDELLASLGSRARAGVERVAVVRAASIDLPDVSGAIAEKRERLGGARVAVSVGRLVPGKRVDRAIEHVARAAAAGDIDALIVVGDGPERSRLEALARARGADVRFVGAVPRTEALAWIGAADCLIHASETEGLSTVVREAELLGTRVVRLDFRLESARARG